MVDLFEGGFSYHELRDTSLPEFIEIYNYAVRVSEKRKNQLEGIK